MSQNVVRIEIRLNSRRNDETDDAIDTMLDSARKIPGAVARMVIEETTPWEPLEELEEIDGDSDFDNEIDDDDLEK